MKNETNTFLLDFSLSDEDLMDFVSTIDPFNPADDRFYCHCGRSYKHKGDLTRHQKYQCGKEPQFRCMHCSFRTALKCNLAGHIRARHLNFCGIEKWTGINKRCYRLKWVFGFSLCVTWPGIFKFLSTIIEKYTLRNKRCYRN